MPACVYACAAKNFARYVHKNPAQTLCGVLVTIAVLLLISSLTSIDSRFTEIDNKIDSEINSLRTDMNAGFTAINNKFDAKFDNVSDNFAAINVKLAVLITALNLDTTVEAAEQGTITGTPP